jgi:tetratricopeptide (TPR) repeat protein
VIQNGTRTSLGEAIRHFENALKFDPTSARTWYLLGRSFEMQGTPGSSLRAIEALKCCVMYDPTNPRYWSSLGVVHLQRGEYANAIASYERAGKDYHACMSLGKAWEYHGHEVGNVPEAERWFMARGAYLDALECATDKETEAAAKERLEEVESRLKGLKVDIPQYNPDSQAPDGQADVSCDVVEAEVEPQQQPELQRQPQPELEPDDTEDDVTANDSAAFLEDRGKTGEDENYHASLGDAEDQETPRVPTPDQSNDRQPSPSEDQQPPKSANKDLGRESSLSSAITLVEDSGTEFSPRNSAHLAESMWDNLVRCYYSSNGFAFGLLVPEGELSDSRVGHPSEYDTSGNFDIGEVLSRLGSDVQSNNSEVSSLRSELERWRAESDERFQALRAEIAQIREQQQSKRKFH